MKKQIINLSDYAKGDSTDESAKVQQAINDAQGKVLQIQEGDYLVKDLCGVSDIEIITQGNPIFRYATSSDIKHGTILQFDGKNNYSIDGLSFDGQFPAEFGTVLQAINGKDVVFRNLKIRNSFGEAVVIGNLENVLIEDCLQEKTDVGILSPGGCRKVAIRRNTAKGGTSDGIFFFEGTTAPQLSVDVLIEDCITSDKINGNGFGLMNIKTVTVKGCRADNCAAGIGATNNNGRPQISDITLLDNQIFDCEKGIAGVFTDALISLNRIYRATFGMWIGSGTGDDKGMIADNLTVTANKATDVQAGFFFSDTNNSTIDKNQVTEDTRKGKTYVAFQVQASKEANAGTNNRFLSNNGKCAQFPFLVLAGTNGNTFRDNIGRFENQGAGNISENNY